MNISVGCVISLSVSMMLLVVASLGCIKVSRRAKENKGLAKNNFLLTPFQILIVGVFLCITAIFYPVYFNKYFVDDYGIILALKSLLLSVHNAMRVFILDGEFDIIKESISDNNIQPVLSVVYTVYAAILYVVAPVLTAGFVLSFFRNANEHIKYFLSTAKNIFYFSELNEKSIALAESIIKEYENKKVLIAFFDVYESREEMSTELIESAHKMGGLCFQKDIVSVRLKKGRKDSNRKFYFLGADEDENINQAIKLIDLCREKPEFNSPYTHFYVFSNTVESEVLLDSIDKGNMKIRRYDESRNLVVDTLLNHSIFTPAGSNESGKKSINILIVGLGKYGTQLLKNICWFGQMPGYDLTINVVDSADQGWNAVEGEAPELVMMSGKRLQGEPYYKINTYLDVDVNSKRLTDVISEMGNLSTVYVTLGDDELNIKTAMRIRRDLCRLGYKTSPPILAVVYSTLKTSIIRENGGIKSIAGDDYGIEFFGDMQSIYSITRIEQVEIEKEALKLHLKWSKTCDELEESKKLFENFEYYRRSSIASFVYSLAQSKINNEGSAYTFDELAEYEHNRWCAYMRAEGYIHDNQAKNHLAKTHPDLKPYSILPKYEKEKDVLILEKEDELVE